MHKAAPASTIGIIALLLTARLAADGPLDHDDVKRLRESGQILPMSQVLEAAYRLQPGQLVEAELEREDDGYHYEIKILDAAGQIHELELDAASAALIHDSDR
ncbi:peptidase M4 [Thiorhodococcus mannitoliphagus]|uniref:Peptidase M4 n=1 Tax=Thiorhodococcus mannitoliphagus TaxID=329406 RepID=A0A6P1E3G1_9GAMM|nr:PepSY domain-containing protein [Thiorhodococcus mannitoliphagus]NEX22564.1 peptidase M4 [Thiorhodococcus mannitoliphagus]